MNHFYSWMKNAMLHSLVITTTWSWSLTTFTVNNQNDNGTGSIENIISEANVNLDNDIVVMFDPNSADTLQTGSFRFFNLFSEPINYDIQNNEPLNSKTITFDGTSFKEANGNINPSIANPNNEGGSLFINSGTVRFKNVNFQRLGAKGEDSFYPLLRTNEDSLTGGSGAGAGLGGALFIRKGSRVTVENGLFKGNQAQGGRNTIIFTYINSSRSHGGQGGGNLNARNYLDNLSSTEHSNGGRGGASITTKPFQRADGGEGANTSVSGGGGGGGLRSKGQSPNSPESTGGRGGDFTGGAGGTVSATSAIRNGKNGEGLGEDGKGFGGGGGGASGQSNLSNVIPSGNGGDGSFGAGGGGGGGGANLSTNDNIPGGNGGNGGFGAGGGAGGNNATNTGYFGGNGGNGGFGAGGGAGARGFGVSPGQGGQGGWGAANGDNGDDPILTPPLNGTAVAAGGWGAGMGGAIFIDNEASLTLIDCRFNTNESWNGINQSGPGQDIFMIHGGELTFEISNGDALFLENPIEGEQGFSNEANQNPEAGFLKKIGPGFLGLILDNTYSSKTLINEGQLHLDVPLTGGNLTLSQGSLGAINPIITPIIRGDVIVSNDAIFSGWGFIAAYSDSPILPDVATLTIQDQATVAPYGLADFNSTQNAESYPSSWVKTIGGKNYVTQIVGEDLFIANTFEQKDQSKHEVRINSVGTQSTVISATDAEISNQAELLVHPFPGNYIVGDRFRFLVLRDGDGNLTEYPTLTLVEAPLGLRLKQTIEADDLAGQTNYYLEVTQANFFENFLPPGNGRDVCESLANIELVPGTDLADIFAILGAVSLQEQERLCDELSPGSYFGNFELWNLNTVHLMQTTLFNRLHAQGTIMQGEMGFGRPLLRNADAIHPVSLDVETSVNQEGTPPKRTPKKASRYFWVAPIGYTATRTKIRDMLGFKIDSVGFLAGADIGMQETIQMGVTAGYHQSSFGFRPNAGSGKISSFVAGLYGSYFASWLLMDFSVLGGMHRFRTTRRVQVQLPFNPLLFTREAQGKHRGFFVAGHLGAVYHGEFFYQLSPFANADLVYIHQKAFTEEPGPISLDITSENALGLRPEIGILWQRSYRHNQMILTPHVAVSIVGKIPLGEAKTEARFIGQDQVFASSGWNKTLVLYALSAGLRMQSERRAIWTLNYNGEFSGKEEIHAGSLKVEWPF